MNQTLHAKLKQPIAAALIGLGIITSSLAFNANADNAALIESVKADYITDCNSNACAMGDAARWSDQPENTNAVAIAVKMGTAKQVPDYQIKSILEQEFANLEVTNVKFFFEINDARNTGVTFHVRGGTDGPYVLDEKIFVAAKKVAAYANDKNHVFAN